MYIMLQKTLSCTGDAIYNIKLYTKVLPSLKQATLNPSSSCPDWGSDCGCGCEEDCGCVEGYDFASFFSCPDWGSHCGCG
jgi:hypothetical protein